MNPCTQSLSVNDVCKFQIHENFQQAFPCSHECEIELIDGSRSTGPLIGTEIYILINAIAKEKISFIRDEQELFFEPQGIDHFDTYAECPYSMFRLDRAKTPLPDELLASFFPLREILPK